jgi:hypothetical protein
MCNVLSPTNNTDAVINMKTLIIKSLLTPGRLRRRQRRVNSLYQREGIYLFFPHSGRIAEVKAEKGKGRDYSIHKRNSTVKGKE